jgi:predicted MPP superfamily phosphohydrolase
VIIAIVVVVLVLLFCWWQNNGIVVSHIEYESEAVPAGCTVLHLSDLHNKTFGKNQIKLIRKTKEISPDIIVITGDLIDGRNKTDIDAAMAYVAQAVRIAPVYCVAGNHEEKSHVYPELKKRLVKENVTVLDDACTTLEKNGGTFYIIGVRDPNFSSDEIFEKNLAMLAGRADKHFKILLTHRPEKWALYKKLKIDITFAGHAHGGQIRLPFIGGLFAPQQGLFPRYTSGMVKEGAASMVVSRGLGNSLFPLRVFNLPELVVVTLKKR